MSKRPFQIYYRIIGKTSFHLYRTKSKEKSKKLPNNGSKSRRRITTLPPLTIINGQPHVIKEFREKYQNPEFIKLIFLRFPTLYNIKSHDLSWIKEKKDEYIKLWKDKGIDIRVFLKKSKTQMVFKFTISYIPIHTIYTTKNHNTKTYIQQKLLNNIIVKDIKNDNKFQFIFPKQSPNYNRLNKKINSKLKNKTKNIPTPFYFFSEIRNSFDWNRQKTKLTQLENIFSTLQINIPQNDSKYFINTYPYSQEILTNFHNCKIKIINYDQ